MTRQYAIEILKDIQKDEVQGSSPYYDTIDEAFNMAIEALEQVPKIGKWRREYEDLLYHCSECEAYWSNAKVMNYCPSCGARMRKSEG